MRTAVLAAALVSLPVLGSAQGEDAGRRSVALFAMATVGGEWANRSVYSRSRLPISQKFRITNSGVFPFGRVYEVVDGRKTIAAHGSRDMPVWGGRFKEKSAELAELALRFGISIDAEAFARDRILALIRYLSSLQEKWVMSAIGTKPTSECATEPFDHQSWGVIFLRCILRLSLLVSVTPIYVSNSERSAVSAALAPR